MNTADADPIEAASAALEVGQPEDALELLADLPAEDPERLLLECLAHMDLSDLAAARHALEAAARILPPDDFDLRWARGELLLREWRVDEARAELEALVAIERSAPLLEKLSLCLDLADDFEGADRLLAQAHALDPDYAPLPPRLDHAAFDAVVAEAVESLPERFRRALDNTRIVTEPMPFAALVADEDPAMTPPDLFGLFTGPTLHERAEGQSAELPPVIYLFQRNLERFSRDEEHLREEIRITLFHEIGHLLGLSEDEVEAMGLG